MSVPVGKRRISEMEFFSNAIRMRKDITMMLLRNFGCKERARDLKLPHGLKIMNSVDREALLDILDRWNAGGEVLVQYPQWLLSHFRDSLLQLLRDLMMQITAANSIYPTMLIEAEERRLLQNKAICTCECLLQELNHIASVLPVDANNILRFVEMADREVALLKGWRKSDNKFFRRFRQQIAGKEEGRSL